jgi:hypothetical protein
LDLLLFNHKTNVRALLLLAVLFLTEKLFKDLFHYLFVPFPSILRCVSPIEIYREGRSSSAMAFKTGELPFGCFFITA